MKTLNINQKIIAGTFGLLALAGTATIATSAYAANENQQNKEETSKINSDSSIKYGSNVKDEPPVGDCVNLEENPGWLDEFGDSLEHAGTCVMITENYYNNYMK